SLLGCSPLPLAWQHSSHSPNLAGRRLSGRGRSRSVPLGILELLGILLVEPALRLARDLLGLVSPRLLGMVPAVLLRDLLLARFGLHRTLLRSSRQASFPDPGESTPGQQRKRALLSQRPFVSSRGQDLNL